MRDDLLPDEPRLGHVRASRADAALPARGHAAFDRALGLAAGEYEVLHAG